jgi:formylglycine-generating enzyme required for sulfatase activity
MGAEEGDGDEKPVHKALITKDFYISDHEVTLAEWNAVMIDNQRSFKGNKTPVKNVSWYEAVEYCNRLSMKEGKNPVYTINGTKVTWDKNGDGYRLPTEAEWEYAARGADKTNDYLYSGTNNADEVAWFKDNSNNKTHTVKDKKANELGLYDMSGNVWEWCWDWFGAYKDEEQRDPVGPATGSYRVVRGGAFDSNVSVVLSANRASYEPESKFSVLGFRIVCTNFKN